MLGEHFSMIYNIQSFKARISKLEKLLGNQQKILKKKI